MNWLGNLNASQITHNPLEVAAGVGMLAGFVGFVGFFTYTKRWKWLWDNWITTLDPKRIGVMYLIVVLLMLFKGLFDAGMMRTQQILSVGDSFGFLTSTHFQEIFSAHGTTMIFFVAMGTIFGLMNLIVPLQIGARDVAFPFMNAISLWIFAIAAFLINVSLVFGKFGAAGWLSYPPLSGIEYSPGVGIDYWIWPVQIGGVSSLMTGINFLVTIFKLRCPGMKAFDMPLFVWGVLGALVLIVFAFPVLTATIGMLTLDRYLGMKFFNSSYGGNFMMYINLIWAWGHPEVYILILPFFGLFSDVVTTFSRKSLFGYTSMVWAIIVITFLSFIVWLHHFFTMGAGPNVNAFFAMMTMLIAIPTGVKIFNWLFTMRKGRIVFELPMLWFIAFLVTFTIGGMTGVILSIPPVDFQLHNSLFLVAHFHNVIIGGVLFGFFAGFTLWFPKVFGFKLHNPTGKWAFWCWFLGFLLAFMPLYILGFMGTTRRLDHYEDGLGWHPLFVVAFIGFVLIIFGVFFQNLQLYISWRRQEKDTTGDIWNGRSLEWATSSPPPVYNFAILPHVDSRDAFWKMKHTEKKEPREYEDIYLPKNTGLAFYIGCFCLLFGFAIIWKIWWLTLLGLFGIVTCLVIRLSQSEEHLEYVITAEEVKKMEENHV